MKKRNLLIAGIIGIIAVIIFVVGAIIISSNQTFSLSSQFYDSDAMTEISISELENLISEKASFILFVYQPDCSTSDDFEKVLVDFRKEYHIGLEKTEFHELKQSKLVADLKYYPSAIIYHDGEVVDFLDADSDADLDAYKSVAGFVGWLSQNKVKLTR